MIMTDENHIPGANAEEHLNSGRWNLLPGGKLNITLFEANFILRLEGQKTTMGWLSLGGWDGMGWLGF